MHSPSLALIGALALAATLQLTWMNLEPAVADRAFASDGCTLFPDGDWGHCCLAHDWDYWAGGSHKERAFSDVRLYICVANTGHPIVAEVMHGAVIFTGTPHLPTPWRWGFGYDGWVGYAKEKR